MQFQQGYVVTLWSKHFIQNTVFLETEPTSKQIEKMIKDARATRAYVTIGDAYRIEDDSLNKSGQTKTERTV